MPFRKVYIAATDQHVGKTTVTMGIINHILRHSLDIGFCKPVGQEFVEFDDGFVDKDIALFGNYFGKELKPHLHSPVILKRGVVSSFLDHPERYQFEEKILAAAEKLERRHQFVVYEGTGHTGVGNVVGLSNAKVASLLNCPVILIAEAGIGSTLDKLMLHILHFQQYQVPIAGVILNKTFPEKRTKVLHYLGKVLNKWGIPLLGALPYDKSLAFSVPGTKLKAQHVQKIQTACALFEEFVPYLTQKLSYDIAADINTEAA